MEYSIYKIDSNKENFTQLLIEEYKLEHLGQSINREKNRNLQDDEYQADIKIEFFSKKCQVK